MQMTRSRGEIGRRAGFRFQWVTVWVQVPSTAPKHRVSRCFSFISGLCAFAPRFACEPIRVWLALALPYASIPFSLLRSLRLLQALRLHQKKSIGLIRKCQTYFSLHKGFIFLSVTIVKCLRECRLALF